ncbi:MAG: hypothetical protein OEW25_00975 [Nitrospira sp.]|nr:hypothetical protein [Nitrospira sp.]MDH5251870.1 hypothetical protein [Nitrospira sp.]
MTYLEGLEIRKKWSNGAIAEQLGFQAAQWDSEPRQMSGDTYLQQRYNQGFYDAKAMMIQEAS